MAIIDLRGDSARIGQSLKGIGTGIESIIDPNKQKREEMRQLLMMDRAGMARKMRDDPAQRAQLKDYFDDKELDAILASNPETYQETLERTQQRMGLAEREVNERFMELAMGDARRENESLKMTRENLISQYAIENETDIDDIVTRQISNTASRARDEQEIKGIIEFDRFLRSQNMTDEDRQRAMLTLSEGGREWLAFQQGQERIRQTDRSLDQTDQSLAMQARGLELEEARLNLQRATAQLEAASSQTEAMVSLFNLKTAFIDEFEAISGKLASGEINSGELEVLLARQNALADDFMSIFPGEPVPILHGDAGWFGTSLETVEYEMVQTQNVVVASILAGQADVDEVVASTRLSDDEKIAIYAQLSDMAEKLDRPALQNALERISTTGLAAQPDAFSAARLHTPHVTPEQQPTQPRRLTARDIQNMTPDQALMAIAELQQELENLPATVERPVTRGIGGNVLQREGAPLGQDIRRRAIEAQIRALQTKAQRTWSFGREPLVNQPN